VNAYPVREYFQCSELARHHPRHLAQLNANIQSAVVARGIQQPLLVAAVFQLAHIAVVEEVAGLFDSDSFAAAEAANIADTAVAVVAVAPPHFLV
jgi:cobyrinic acid a,c-diamide synthase